MAIKNKLKKLPPLSPGKRCAYVAFFLTLGCNLKCPYCINTHGAHKSKNVREDIMPVDEWIKAADRLSLSGDLPLTLQGGEPTIYPGFYKFVNEVKEEIKMDLLTNMTFDPKVFIKNVPVRRFTREAPYAAIRVSYHPGQNDIDDLIEKAFKLQDAGFRIGVYALESPDPETKKHVEDVRERCLKQGIDFRYKEFLGEWDGKLYGMYKYEGSVLGGEMKSCECRTTELIVDPAGYVYRCHADLYKKRAPVAHILDDDFSAESLGIFRACGNYGGCNPCDVKVKTNRFQVFGHTSVEIRNIRETVNG